MANAAAMINICFEHQHPELFGRPEVAPEFPIEGAVRGEPIPDGANSEGFVWPDNVVPLVE